METATPAALIDKTPAGREEKLLSAGKRTAEHWPWKEEDVDCSSAGEAIVAMRERERDGIASSSPRRMPLPSTELLFED